MFIENLCMYISGTTRSQRILLAIGQWRLAGWYRRHDIFLLMASVIFVCAALALVLTGSSTYWVYTTLMTINVIHASIWVTLIYAWRKVCEARYSGIWASRGLGIQLIQTRAFARHLIFANNGYVKKVDDYVTMCNGPEGTIARDGSTKDRVRYDQIRYGALVLYYLSGIPHHGRIDHEIDSMIRMDEVRRQRRAEAFFALIHWVSVKLGFKSAFLASR